MNYFSQSPAPSFDFSAPPNTARYDAAQPQGMNEFSEVAATEHLYGNVQSQGFVDNQVNFGQNFPFQRPDNEFLTFANHYDAPQQPTAQANGYYSHEVHVGQGFPFQSSGDRFSPSANNYNIPKQPTLPENGYYSREIPAPTNFPPQSVSIGSSNTVDYPHFAAPLYTAPSVHDGSLVELTNVGSRLRRPSHTAVWSADRTVKTVPPVAPGPLVVASSSTLAPSLQSTHQPHQPPPVDEPHNQGFKAFVQVTAHHVLNKQKRRRRGKVGAASCSGSGMSAELRASPPPPSAAASEGKGKQKADDLRTPVPETPSPFPAPEHASKRLRTEAASMYAEPPTTSALAPTTLPTVQRPVPPSPTFAVPSDPALPTLPVPGPPTGPSLEQVVYLSPEAIAELHPLQHAVTDRVPVQNLANLFVFGELLKDVRMASLRFGIIPPGRFYRNVTSGQVWMRTSQALLARFYSTVCEAESECAIVSPNPPYTLDDLEVRLQAQVFNRYPFLCGWFCSVQEYQPISEADTAAALAAFQVM